MNSVFLGDVSSVMDVQSYMYKLKENFLTSSLRQENELDTKSTGPIYKTSFNRMPEMQVQSCMHMLHGKLHLIYIRNLARAD